MLNNVRQKKIYTNFVQKFDHHFEKIIRDVYGENKIRYSEFIFGDKFCKDDYKTHPLYKGMKIMHLIFSDKTLLHTVSNKDLMKSMDNVLALYAFSYWSFNSFSENLMNLRICILFREFVNFMGWDYLQSLANYKIIDKNIINIKDEYSNVMLTENLPEIIDDFLGVFLKADAPGFSNNLSEIKYFITEFCSFIYHEGVINYIVEPVE